MSYSPVVLIFSYRMVWKVAFVPRPWLIKGRFVLGVVCWTVTINTIFFAYNCGPLWHHVFFLVLGLGLEPDTYVDEYLWTLRPHNSPSKSFSLAPRVERRILTFLGMFWARHVLSSTSTSAFLTAQGTLLTLQRLERALIKFLLLLVPHILHCVVMEQLNLIH